MKITWCFNFRADKEVVCKVINLILFMFFVCDRSAGQITSRRTAKKNQKDLTVKQIPCHSFNFRGYLLRYVPPLWYRLRPYHVPWIWLIEWHLIDAPQYRNPWTQHKASTGSMNCNMSWLVLLFRDHVWAGQQTFVLPLYFQLVTMISAIDHAAKGHILGLS